MGSAINRNKVAIAIVNADVVATALAASDYINGQIKSYNKSGGERDTESDPHFGGFVDKEKPISQFEVEFEVTPDLADADRWDSLAYNEDGSNSGVYTSRGSVADKAVFIGAADGTNIKAWGFNNCNVTMFDLEHNADDNQTGTLNLKFSPETSDGVANFITASSASALANTAAPGAVLPAWTALDGN